MDYVVVFGPQGAPTRSRLEALHRSSGSLGSWLVKEAFAAYCDEVQYARQQREPSMAAVPLPRTIDQFLVLDNEHQGHQAIKSFLHCLVQSLCVFSTLERQRVPLQNLLGSETNRIHAIGFCTGVLSAQAFATSSRLSEFVFRLTESLRLAFWIGLRVEQAAATMTQEEHTESKAVRWVPNEPWCAVASPCSLSDMEGLLEDFSKSNGGQKSPWITVISSMTRLSIGGTPTALQEFRAFVMGKHKAGQSRVQLHLIQLNAPYHSQQWLSEAAEQVRQDVVSRHIHLGSIARGQRIFDNASGDVLQEDSDLARSFINSILLERGRWDLMTNKLESMIVENGKDERTVCVVNGGPDQWHASDLHQRMRRGGAQSELNSYDAPTASTSTPVSLSKLADSRRPSLSTTDSSVSSSSDSGNETSLSGPLSSKVYSQNRTIAITAAYFGQMEDESQQAFEKTMGQAAAHMHTNAPSCYLNDDSYASQLACFLNESAGGQGLTLLQRLIADHDWPDPILLGQEKRSGLFATLHRACHALKQDFCKVALAGGIEYQTGGKKVVAYLMLERMDDAQKAGTRPLGVVLQSASKRPRKWLSNSHEQLIRKVVKSAELEWLDVTSYSGKDGQMVEDASRLYDEAAQHNLPQASALEKMLAYYGDEVESEEERDDARRTLLYTIEESGSVAALLCQEPPTSASLRLHFIGLSADNQDELQDRIASLRKTLSDTATLEVADVAFATLTKFATEGKHRIGFTASTIEDVAPSLEKALSSGTESTYHRAVAFVFPGQGCQYKDMGHDLFVQCAPFRQRMERCGRLCLAQGFPDFLSSIYADGGSAATTKEPQQDQSLKDQADQLAIFSLEVSLAETLIAWGVEPVCVAGHSLGHYAACYIAGVLSLSDALFLVARRASLFAQLCKPQQSQMMAVANCTEEELQKHITEAQSTATIACYNGPTDHVLSGTREDLPKLHKHLRAQSIKAKLLEVPFGFHSDHIAAVVDDLLRGAQCVSILPPRIAITSTVLGKLILPGEIVFDAPYFAKHTQQPVRFHSAITAANHASSRLNITDWVEVGPNPICTPMLKASPSAESMTKLTTVKRGTDSWSNLVSLLGTLWTSGYSSIAWKACLLSSGQSYQATNSLLAPSASAYSSPMRRGGSSSTANATRRSSLFDPLFSATPSSADALVNGVSNRLRSRADKLPTAGPWLDDDNKEEGVSGYYHASLSKLEALLRSHRVVGMPVLSASVYGELALQASCASKGLSCQVRAGSSRAVVISNLLFRASMVVPNEEAEHPKPQTARLVLKIDDSSDRPQSFEVSLEQEDKQMRRLMTGEVEIDGSEEGDAMDRDVNAQQSLRRLLEMQRERRNDDAGYSTLASDLAYGLFAKRVEYVQDYRALQSITLAPPSERQAEAFATVRAPLASTSSAASSSSGGSFLSSMTKETVLHPILLDTLLHAGGFVANESPHLVKPSESFLCARIDEIRFCDVAALRADATYRIHVRVRGAAPGTNDVVCDTHLFDEDDLRVLAWARGVHFRKAQTSKLVDVLTCASLDSGKQSDVNFLDPLLHALEQVRLQDEEEEYAEEESYTQILMSNLDVYDDEVAFKKPTVSSAAAAEDELLFRLFPGLRGCALDPLPSISSGTGSKAQTGSRSDSSSSLQSFPSSSLLASSPGQQQAPSQDSSMLPYSPPTSVDSAVHSPTPVVKSWLNDKYEAERQVASIESAAGNG